MVELLIRLSQAVKLFWAICALVLVIACLAGKRVRHRPGGQQLVVAAHCVTCYEKLQLLSIAKQAKESHGKLYV